MKLNYQFFYFDDKDVFDALMSEKRRISNETLIQFLRGKGIVVSKQLSREELCDYISTWFRDYQTLESLSLGERKKRETTKFESEEVSVQNPEDCISVEDVRSTIDQLRNSLSDQGQSLVLEPDADGNVTNLIWTRDVIDFSQTPLRQRTRRSDKIQILRTESGKVHVRTPTHESCASLRSAFVAELQNVTGHVFSRTEIRIKENASSEARIAFFLDILNGMPSYIPQTVTVVNLVSNDAESDDDGNDIEAENMARVDFQGLLQAKLHGGRLLETPEYIDLKERGFSPSEIRWWATAPDGKTLVQFWFGFSNAKEGTGFFCNVVNVRRWSSEQQSVLKTPEKPTDSEHDRYLSVLEETVRRVYKQQFSDMEREDN